MTTKKSLFYPRHRRARRHAAPLTCRPNRPDISADPDGDRIVFGVVGQDVDLVKIPARRCPGVFKREFISLFSLNFRFLHGIPEIRPAQHADIEYFKGALCIRNHRDDPGDLFADGSP